jgi:hypothetical protein
VGSLVSLRRRDAISLNSSHRIASSDLPGYMYWYVVWLPVWFLVWDRTWSRQGAPITRAWPDASPSTTPRLSEIAPKSFAPVETDGALPTIAAGKDHVYWQLELC